jgi:flavodoxin
MNSVVIYGSRHGNTRKVAEVIAGELEHHGRVQLMSVDEALDFLPVPTDLVVIGGPTEAHRMTEPMAAFFERVPKGAMAGIAAAAFDTRIRWPRLLSGSAGAGIVEKLASRGARVIAKEESFFVTGVSPKHLEAPVLERGELERAAEWALSLADKVETTELTAPKPAREAFVRPDSAGPGALRHGGRTAGAGSLLALLTK